MKKPSLTETGRLPEIKGKRNERLRPSVPSHVQNLLRLHRQRNARTSAPEIPSDARVIIIEGIAGSGKDTLQGYLKKRLKGRDVHDFLEGELLQSWKHAVIDGILEFRLKFLKLFVSHIRTTINRNDNAVFLLNRFHLTTYAAITSRQPELKTAYAEIVDALRTLPVHVFILQLDEHEIDKRSSHSERSGMFPKVQQELVIKDGFRNRAEKFIAQQRLIIRAATEQQIPYSVVKFPYAVSEKLSAARPEKAVPSSNVFRKM